MRYLFFDIECANCFQGKGKICSFGYVLTDTSFEVLDKYDMVINPASKFNLGPDIVLAYDKNTFKHAPLFPDFYPEITTLLEDEDTLVFGFSASNDARYLNNDCMRYDLPSIDYRLYDVQQILMGMKETRNQPSLLGSCLEYGINVNQNIHKSDDDSLMTMKLFREMCRSAGKSPLELIEEYGQCKGVSDDYKFIWTDPLPKPVKESHEQNALSNKMSKTGENYQKFLSLLDTLTPAEEGELLGMRIILSSYYEEKHFRQMSLLAKFISEAGGRYVTRLAEANVFAEKRVYRANGNIRACPRLATVRRMNAKGERIKVISFAELLEILSLDEQTLDGMADAMMYDFPTESDTPATV